MLPRPPRPPVSRPPNRPLPAGVPATRFPTYSPGTAACGPPGGLAVRRLLPGLVVAVALLAPVLAVLPAAAQEAPPARPPQTLVVGTKVAPPFAMQDEAGNWTGISIELWRDVAHKLGRTYEVREYDLEGLLKAVESREVDVGVAALTITQERERRMDFTHPFYTTGYGIALLPLGDPGWMAVVERILSWRFLGSLLLLIATLLGIGSLVWLAERRANPEQFGGTGGIWSGFWWAAVTATTVGYGDKAPKTVLGRALALLWMFIALVLIGTFIAQMSSALTVNRLQGPIRGPEDLPTSTVATLPASTSEAYLRENRIAFQYADNLEAAFGQLVERQVDAVVYDAPLLKYLASHGFQGQVEVLPRTFGRQDYCIALPTGSELREPINWILLADTTQARLRDILYRYLEQAPPPPARPEAGEGEE